MTRARPGEDSDQPGGRRPEAAGWSVFSYLIGGMLLYGGIGWLIGHWTHIPVLFPVGMLAGIALAIGLVIFRFRRP